MDRSICVKQRYISFFVLSIEIFLLSTHLSIEIFMHVIGEDKQTDKGLSVSGWELIETK